MATAPLGGSILREWDEASKARRKELLQWLQGCLRDAYRGGFDLESTCGADVSLVLPRILAWIDRTNGPSNLTARALSHEVVATDEQLACLELFLEAPMNPHVYVREFIHADGLRVLLETLQRHSDRLSSQQRCVIYRILLRLMQRSRAHKAQISQLEGETALVRGAIAAVDATSESVKPSANLQSPVWTLCRATLLEQMVGNSAYTESTHRVIFLMLHHALINVKVFGAQILRELISETSFYFDANYWSSMQIELVPHCIELLQSTHLSLQHEGLELIHTLLQRPKARRPICSLLASWIHEAALAADHLDPAYASMQHTREYDVYSHLQSSFVRAAQSLTTLLHSTPRLLSLLVDKHEILIPMAFVLTVERPHSLKWLAALTAIHFLFMRWNKVTVSHLSELFLLPIDRLAHLPPQLRSEELAMELVGDDTHRRLVALQFHRNGWVKPKGPPPPEGDLDHISEDTVDPQLDAIAYAMDAAVNPVLPGYLLDSSFEEDDDTLNDDDSDFATQQRLQQKLEDHFRRFRVYTVPACAAKSHLKR